MTRPTTTYFVLLRSGETARRPGAVLRRRPDGAGFTDEIHRPGDGWQPTGLIRDNDPENTDCVLVEVSAEFAERTVAGRVPSLRLAETSTPPRLPSPEAALPETERPKVVAFLRDAPLALAGYGTGEDPYDGDLPVVPLHIHTDGVWVWSESSAYFAERYGLPPEPELLAHIRARGYRWPEVDDQTLRDAGRLVFGDDAGPGPV